MDDWKFGDDFPVDSMSFGDFTTYQQFTATTDKAGTNLNCVLGMMGECGEVAEKLKKLTRTEHLENIPFLDFPEDVRKDLAMEAADILWYASRFVARLGFRLGDVVKMNVDKLSSRKDRGVLHGKGDNR
jgi:NTP pyrophosphatase (non-canonical NTP hydrolase)